MNTTTSLNRIVRRCMSTSPESNLAALKIVLPPAGQPKGSYVMAVKSNNLLFLAGHIPSKDGGLLTGKVGADRSIDEGKEAARVCAINLISTMKGELGDLSRVKRVVKLTGFVNCVDGFDQQPAVINGASDLFVQVFGDKGKHARSAVGTNSLPLNITAEVEAIVEFD